MADSKESPASGLWTRTIASLKLKLSVINSFYLCKFSHHFPITKTGLADCRLAARVWRSNKIKAEAEYCEHCQNGYIITYSKRKDLPDEPRQRTTTNNA